MTQSRRLTALLVALIATSIWTSVQYGPVQEEVVVEPPAVDDGRLERQADDGVQLAIGRLQTVISDMPEHRMFAQLDRSTAFAPPAPGMRREVTILDAAAQIDINMDSAGLARMLDALGEEIDAHFADGFELQRALAAGQVRTADGRRLRGLGDWLLHHRTRLGGRFDNEAQLLAALEAQTPESARQSYRKLRDFVVLHGVRDDTVLDPASRTTARMRGDRREARSAINVNTASAPVLAAWLRGLSYRVGDRVVDLERKHGAARLRDIARKLRSFVDTSLLWSRHVLHRVIEPDPGFHCWGGSADAKQRWIALSASMEVLDARDRAALWAMADPNANLVEGDLPRLVRQSIDKTSIVRWTTELTVLPSDYFEIRSEVQGGGRQVERRAVVQLTGRVVNTTQVDFERDRHTTGWSVQYNQAAEVVEDGMPTIVSLPVVAGESPSRTDGSLITGSRGGLTVLVDRRLEWRDPLTPRALVQIRARGQALEQRRRGATRWSPLVARDGGPARPVAADFHPEGVRIDRRGRRALRVPGTFLGGEGEGCARFWIRPSSDRSPEGAVDSYLRWSNGHGESIRVYRKGQELIAEFSLGTVGDRRLRHDVGSWKARTWHQIHVDWADGGRLFVDGDRACLGGVHVPHLGARMPLDAARASMATPSTTINRPWAHLEARHASARPRRPGRRYRAPVAGSTLDIGYARTVVGDRVVEHWANATIADIQLFDARVLEEESPSAGFPMRYDLGSGHRPPSMYWQALGPRLAHLKHDVELLNVRINRAHQHEESIDSFTRLYVQMARDDVQEVMG